VRHPRTAVWFTFCLALSIAGATAEPFALHPANRHYFLFRGKPTVLVTSAEHYGAVINSKFNYIAYLDELHRHRLNNTRIWVGPYREVAGNFGIANNTLAPESADFLAPWPRSGTPGAADGLNKFDLEKWNDAFFVRLKKFIREAARRDIVVEVNLFCPYYEESMWTVSPFQAKNNINSVGDMPKNEALTLKHPALLKIQEALVRKIVAEVNQFDNIYFEIANEPYFGGVTLEWQEHIASLIHKEESVAGRRRHLISQNYANGSKRVEKPLDTVSIYNFHYSRPASSVSMNYELGRALGNNETGFDGTADATYRVQGWEYLMAGGALYNNLDYSFIVGHERGDFAYKDTTPGGGSTALRAQLGALRKFFDTLPFVKMAPVQDLVRSKVPEGATIRALAQPGAVYAIYIHHGRSVKNTKPQYVVDQQPQTLTLELDLPAGTYIPTWLHPATGAVTRSPKLTHAGGTLRLVSSTYTEDLALRLTKSR